MLNPIPFSSASRAASMDPPAASQNAPPSAAVRNLQPQDVLVAERAVAQFGNVLRLVHQPHVVVGGRLRLHEVFRHREPAAQHTVFQPAIFLGWKDVLPEVQIVAFVVNQPVRQHGPGCRQSVSDCSAVTTATLKISSAEQPRERSLAGFARPCRNGPMAIAPPNRSTICNRYWPIPGWGIPAYWPARPPSTPAPCSCPLPGPPPRPPAIRHRRSAPARAHARSPWPPPPC